jgi:Rieske Fe-S protein
MPTRRDLYRWGTVALGSLMGVALAVPGVAYVLDPLRNGSAKGKPHTLARLDDLKVGEPKAFAVIDERTDAWVKYPREPIGSVWLIRQPDDTVLALQAECPHLGCAINLTDDGKQFLCPCHTSAFDLKGDRLNAIPPRGMDTLECEVAADGRVTVRFERFRTQSEEKIPLA